MVLSTEKAYHKELEDDLSSQLQSAWHRRSFAVAWQITRRIAGAARGSKRKWGKLPFTAVPCAAELALRSARPGYEGGWGSGARRVSDDDMMNYELDDDAIDNDIAVLRARDAMNLLRKVARNAALRKGVPSWDIPAEFWRVVFHPHFVPRFSQSKSDNASWHLEKRKNNE